MPVARVELDEVVAVADFRAKLRVFLRASETKARRNGLTPQRYHLLLMIKGAPDRTEMLSVTDLAGRLQIAQSTATELVTRAEESGLVRRVASPRDARLALVQLTAEGERRLARCFEDLAFEREQLRNAVEALG